MKEELSKYYLSMKHTLKWPYTNTQKLDKNGVILYKVPYTQNFDYYPVNIALYALGNFEMFLDTKKESYRKKFLKQLDWLTSNITVKEDFGVWEHRFVLPYYKFDRIPWVHGMAQGVAISALVRGYQLTGNKEYLKIAEKAYGAFERNIEDGGIKYVDEKGNVWFEEYAIFPLPHILNGFIYALLGVYDLYSTTKNSRA
ncbi:MAG TPA: hypothetical protein ENI51_06255, partial [Candidatus Atribacteria bacterium]|nr:hypothetical protein [Candidatus Atribacteria bacterium]